MSELLKEWRTIRKGWLSANDRMARAKTAEERYKCRVLAAFCKAKAEVLLDRLIKESGVS
jgi:hypothetical protein